MAQLGHKGDAAGWTLTEQAGIAALALFVVFAAILPLPLSQQAVLAWGVVLLQVLLHRTLINHHLVLRSVLILSSLLISTRYILFRLFYTLWGYDFLDSVATWTLFAAELYGFTVHTLGAIIALYPYDRRARSPKGPPEQWPRVDVFIPTYNEDIRVVEVTTIAATQMDWPADRMRVFILDDGSTDARCASGNPVVADAARKRRAEMASLAERWGARLICRPDNGHAKAGNLNYALQQTEHDPDAGDLILFLDCDHAPTKDFLRKTTGFFQRDPKLFLVQTPHFFSNPDPIERNLDRWEQSPGENELFYYGIQKGLDAWNASFFCGSAAVMRRRFLHDVGGISGESITEDCETALKLHRRGLNSAYLAQPMVCGLSPETFADFITQRSRWAVGMTQIFLLANPFTCRGLTPMQRLCYLNSMLFWFFGWARLVFFLSPLLFIFFGVKVYNLSPVTIFAYTVPHLVSSFLLSNFLFGHLRKPFVSDLYEIVQSFYLLPQILSTFWSPRSPRFVVTPKNITMDKDSLSTISWPFFLLFALNLLALPFMVNIWFAYPLQRETVVLCIFWGLFNLGLSFLCLGTVWERRQWRNSPRILTREQVTLCRGADEATRDEATLKDLSLGGGAVVVVTETPPQVGETLILQATDSYGKEHRLKAEVIRSSHPPGHQQKEWLLSLRFATTKPEDMAAVVSYLYGDSQRWRNFLERRRRRVSLGRGLHELIIQGSINTLRVFRDIFYSGLQQFYDAARWGYRQLLFREQKVDDPK